MESIDNKMELTGSRMNIKSFFAVEKVPPMFQGGKRDWSVDVLRCVSCFMVCAIHATDSTVTTGIVSGFGLTDCMYHIVFRTILGSPTVLFVIVSGIFFLSPERHVTPKKIWKKNILKMASAYVFWCLIYALVRIHYMDPKPEITFSLVTQEWMIQHSHLWYIPMIVTLYILAPIIRPFTASGDTRLFKYFIGVFIGGMCLWTLYYWPNLDCSETIIIPLIDKTPMAAICQFSFWMIFGWIAYTYRPKKPFRYFIYFMGLMAIAVGLYCNYINWDIERFTMDAVTQKFSIFIFLKNTALFYFILTVFRDHSFSKFTKAFLRKLSDYTLIIYLVHYIPILYLQNNSILWDHGISPWLSVWITALFAYVSGGIFAWLFHICWDPIRAALFSNK